MPEWIDSHKNPPAVGQEVYYFGINIGIHIGKYIYEERSIPRKDGSEIKLCPHVFVNNDWGVVDACDAPRWIPYDAERAKSWVPLPPLEYMQEIMDELTELAKRNKTADSK